MINLFGKTHGIIVVSVNQVIVLTLLVEPIRVASLKVCSPDTDVNFKPAGCLLKFMDCLLAVGFASVHLRLDSYMRGCRCSMIMGFTKPIEHSNPT